MLATILCAIGLALIVYRYDMYEREPWYMLVLACALGGFAYWVLSYAEDVALEYVPGGPTSRAAQAAVAAISEELAKLLIVVAIWLIARHHFNDPFDGLIYGAMGGLGFGIGESAFYLELMGARITQISAASQESVRLMLHLLLGGLTCFGLGLARFRVGRWRLLLVSSVTGSTLIHFLWDYYCGLADSHVNAMQQRLVAVVLMLTALLLFGMSVMVALEHSANTHGKNEWKALWGWPFHYFMRGPKE